MHTKQSGYQLIIYKSNTDEFTATADGRVLFNISKIGDSNVYNFRHLWNCGEITTHRAILENSSLLNYEWYVPDKQQRKDKGRDYVAGVSIILKCSGIKTFPTIQQINQAQQQALEKQYQEAERKAQEQAKDAPSSGTGFFLSKDGYIATNYHVIADAKTLAVTGANGDYNTTYSVSVEQVDTYNDLAILKVNDTQFKQLANNPPYKIRQSIAEIGENCYVLGYPLISTMGTDIKLTNGIISARTGFQGDVSQYQISAPVQPGNSGGPLFDKNGNIVGVVSAKHTGAENAGYAIKTSYLQNLIELVEPAISLPQYNALLGKSLPEQVKLSKNYVCIILANIVKERENSETVGNIIDKPSAAHRPKRVISPVNIAKQYCSNTEIISVELSDGCTILNLQCTNQYYDSGGWCNINKSAYITDGKNQYRMITTYNIEIAPEKSFFEERGEILEFSLIFPPLPPNTSKIDLIESSQSPWRFYGISLE